MNGRIAHTVSGKPIGRPTFLVLEECDDEWMIYYLDSEQKILTHLHVTSREDAHLQAMHDFEIQPDEWVES